MELHLHTLRVEYFIWPVLRSIPHTIWYIGKSHIVASHLQLATIYPQWPFFFFNCWRATFQSGLSLYTRLRMLTTCSELTTQYSFGNRLDTSFTYCSNFCLVSNLFNWQGVPLVAGPLWVRIFFRTEYWHHITWLPVRAPIRQAT